MRLGPVTLANLASWCRAGCIKVTQASRLDAMGSSKVLHHSFAGKLGKAIRIDWVRTCALDNRNALRFAVNGAARRKHDRANSSPNHRVEQHPRAVDIYVVI